MRSGAWPAGCASTVVDAQSRCADGGWHCVHDDEMIRQNVGTKTGQDMGHLAQAGPGGMIEVLDTMPAKRKILIHINNTNPILDEDSPERAQLTQHGIEVAWDGMQIELVEPL